VKQRVNYRFLIGVGGVGSGMFVALRGNETLGRNESRAGSILRRRDFCKLHIIDHYVARLLGPASQANQVQVFPVAKIGDDAVGSVLLEQMRQAGMDVRFVETMPGLSTLFSVCFQYPDGQGGNITTDESAASRLSEQDVERAVSQVMQLMGGRPGIALAAPEAPLGPRRRLLELAKRQGWFTAGAFTTAEADAAMKMGFPALLDLLSVNEDEAAAITGMPPDAPLEQVVQAAGRRLAGEGNRGIRLCVTAGGRGAFGWSDGKLEHTPAPPVEPVNTAGAGDASLSALIVAEALGLPFILPHRPRRRSLGELPLATGMDLAALLAGLAVECEDTINFDADAAAVRALADRIGADIRAFGLG
jgi:sugar/nucleoside kinase (ribokinase family)